MCGLLLLRRRGLLTQNGRYGACCPVSSPDAPRLAARGRSRRGSATQAKPAAPPSRINSLRRRWGRHLVFSLPGLLPRAACALPGIYAGSRASAPPMRGQALLQFIHHVLQPKPVPSRCKDLGRHTLLQLPVSSGRVRETTRKLWFHPLPAALTTRRSQTTRQGRTSSPRPTFDSSTVARRGTISISIFDSIT